MSRSGRLCYLLTLLLVPGCKAPDAAPAYSCLALCEVISRASQFQDREVCLYGQITTNPEEVFVHEDGCFVDSRTRGAVWLEHGEGDRWYAPNITYEQFSEASAQGFSERLILDAPWFSAPSTTFIKTKASKELARRLHKDSSVPATLLGKFQYTLSGLLTRDQKGGIKWSPGFGHMGGFSYRLVLRNVLSVGTSNSNSHNQPHNYGLQPTVWRALGPRPGSVSRLRAARG